MENVVMSGDMAYREELTSQIAEGQFKSAFEHRYGRGWQRKLGAVLDVPETTVNGWFKSGKFPPLAKLAFGTLLSRPLRTPGNWTPVKNGARYAVCETEGPIGRIVADNISNPEDATLVAAAPRLLKTGCDVWGVLNDARDLIGCGEWADELEAALDAAIYSREGGNGMAGLTEADHKQIDKQIGELFDGIEEPIIDERTAQRLKKAKFAGRRTRQREAQRKPGGS